MQKYSVLETISSKYNQMFSAEKKVADFIMKQPDKVILMNVSELAGESEVSDATVIRMCKHVGYQGYYQMKIHLSHELGRNEIRDGQKENPDTVKGVLSLLTYNILDMAENFDTDTIKKCAGMIKESNTIYISAIGNTIPVAMDLGYRLGRYGFSTFHQVVPEYCITGIGNARPGDLLIAMSGSGSSRQVLQAMELGKDKGLFCIGITKEQKSPLSKLSNLLVVTKSHQTLFDEGYGLWSHLNEMAINDLIMYFIIQEDIEKGVLRKIPENNLEVEYLLSETRA